MEYSKDQIPFLDVLIKRNENGIWMDLYHKFTDTQRCLPFTVSHPNHCKRNIPFCLARKICTIAENNTENLEILKLDLSKYQNKRRIPEDTLYTKKDPINRQMKISCHFVQH